MKVQFITNCTCCTIDFLMPYKEHMTEWVFFRWGFSQFKIRIRKHHKISLLLARSTIIMYGFYRNMQMTYAAMVVWVQRLGKIPVTTRIMKQNRSQNTTMCPGRPATHWQPNTPNTSNPDLTSHPDTLPGKFFYCIFYLERHAFVFFFEFFASSSNSIQNILN